MSIAYGSGGTSSNVNAAFMSRTVDTDTVGKVTINNATSSTNKDTGALIVEGGAGVEENLNAGGNIAAVGSLSGASASVSGTATIGTVAATTVNTTTLNATGTSTIVDADVTTLDVSGVSTLNTVSAASISTTGSMTVGGDLTVNGNTTTINAATLDVEDINITVNFGGNDATSEGAGLTVDRTGTSGSLIYADASATKFKAGALGSEVDLVGVSSTQALTNKTIDSDNNTITNIVNADIKAAAAIALDKLAATTASRSLVSDASGFVTASATTSTEIGYVSGVTSAIQTQLNAKATDASVVHLAGSETITGVKTFDTETVNKHISTPANPSSGYLKLYAKSDNKFYKLDSSGNEVLIGSGSGSGGINFIEYGDAEAGTTNWSTYADAAGTRPVDGTGGSPTVTWTTSSSSPLYGTNSFLFTKDAANRQGEGAAYAFAVSPAHKAKSIKISIDYIVSSGTFVAGTSTADSDLIVYIYDVTNSQLIEPSNFKFFSSSSSVSDKFEGYFQTSATGTSYRLIFHCASTSASAYVLKIDNIVVGPSVAVYGSPVTDWVAMPTTLTNFGNGTANLFMRQVGDSLKVKGNLVIGSSLPSGIIRFTIPYTVDYSNKLDDGVLGGDSTQAVGSAISYAPNHYDTAIFRWGTTTNEFYFHGETSAGYGNGADWNAISPVTWTAGDTINITEMEVPILGWSSSTRLSDGYDGREISTRLYLSSNPTVSTGVETTIPFDSSEWDTTASLNPSTYKWKVSSSGYYDLSLFMYCSATNLVSAALYYRVNGGTAYPMDVRVINSAGGGAQGNASAYLTAGQEIDFRYNITGTGTITVQGNSHWTNATITKRQSPQTTSHSARYSASAQSSAGQTINNTSPIFVAGTELWDTHGNYNASTGEFTVHKACEIDIVSTIVTANTAWTLGHSVYLILYRNGSVNKVMGAVRVQATNTFTMPVHGNASAQCVAGDVLTVRIFSDTSTTLLTDAASNWIEFREVK